MKKNISKLLLISTILFAVSCTTTENSEISSILSETTSEITSEVTISESYSSETSLESSSSSESIIISDSSSASSESSSTSSSESSSSSSEEIKYLSIKEIKEIAKSYVGKENNVGVYESTFYVETELKLLAALDAITTKTGYGDRYKLLMTDGEDYIYIKVPAQSYDYVKDYVNNQDIYRIEGYISLYCGEVEITSSVKPVWLEGKTLEVNYSDFVNSQSLQQIYTSIDNLTLNTKGIAFSNLVSVDVKCLAKDINNTNLYFGAGNYIINVHGHDKVTNKFVEGNSYNLIGALSMHNYRPGLEFVDSTSLENEVAIDFSNLTSLKCSDFYDYTYKVDEGETYPNYTHLFQHPIQVTGYLNLYVKDNKGYVVLEDNYKEEPYNTINNAKDAKTIMLVNEDYVKVSSITKLDIYDFLTTPAQVNAIVFPYLWNTSKYPQVYLYKI